MCIEAPESSTHFLSFGFVEDGAGGHQTSEGEKNVALSFSLGLRTPFAISRAPLRAHRSFQSLFLRPVLIFLEHKGCAHEVQNAE